MTINKLFFQFICDDARRQVLTVERHGEDFETKFMRRGCQLSDDHWQTINQAFSLFNDSLTENVYRIEFDSGLTDGIESVAIRRDLA